MKSFKFLIRKSGLMFTTFHYYYYSIADIERRFIDCLKRWIDELTEEEKIKYNANNFKATIIQDMS